MNKIKRILVTFLALALALTFIPTINAQAAKKTTKAVVVKTQAQLVDALKSGAKNITLKTNSKITVKIPKGDFYNVKLTINAPKATISNKGDFLSIKIVDATAIKEFASGNDITITDNKLKVTVGASSIGANIKTTAKNANITLVVNGEPDSVVVAGEKTTLDIKSGTTLEPIPVTVTGSESNIKTALNADVVSEVATQVVSKTDDALVTVENKSDEKVEVISASGESKEIASGEAAVVDNGKVDSYIADNNNKTDANGNKVNDKTPVKNPSSGSAGGSAGGSGSSDGGYSPAPSYDGGLISGLKAYFLNNDWNPVSLANYTYNIPAWTDAEKATFADGDANNDEDWHHDISSSTEFRVKKDYKYKVAFTIESDDARTITARIDQNSSLKTIPEGENLGYAWHGSKNVTLAAGTAQDVEFYVVPENNDNYARLVISVTSKESTGAAKVTIKNVKIVEVGLETPAPGGDGPVTPVNLLADTDLASLTQFKNTASGTGANNKVTIANSGANMGDVIIQKTSIPVKNGATYTFSMDVTNSKTWKIGVQFMDANWGSEIANIWDEFNNNKPLTKTVVASGDAMQIQILLGYDAPTEANTEANSGSATVEFANIKLEKTADAPVALLTNGDFSQGKGSWDFLVADWLIDEAARDNVNNTFYADAAGKKAIAIYKNLGTENWNNRLRIANLALDSSKSYVYTLHVKSDTARKVTLCINSSQYEGRDLIPGDNTIVYTIDAGKASASSTIDFMFGIDSKESVESFTATNYKMEFSDISLVEVNE